MKRLFFIMVLFLAFASCKQDVAVDDSVAAKQVELSFNLEQLGEQFAEVGTTLNKHDYGTKPDGTIQEYPTCTDDEAEYVEVTIDGVKYTVQFTELDTDETEVLLLEASAPNVITEFIVYNAGGVEIYEMPKATSKESLEGGLTGVPYDLDLRAFYKNKVEIDVVCYNEYSYEVLTWNWYKINYYEINTLCFYGDICTKFFEWFHVKGSVYEGQQYSGYDFPAIFEVVIMNGDEVVETKSNIQWYGIGEPLCIEYLDDSQVDEDFSYAIYLIMPDGSKELLTEQDFEDGANSGDGFGGDDGIVTFDVGNCDSQGNNDVEFEFPAVLPLPETATFRVDGPLYSNGYAQLTITDQEAGLWAWGTQTIFEGYCADKYNLINLGVEYPSTVHSSLELAPGEFGLDSEDVGQLNWIVNNWDGYSYEDIQQAIWWITDEYGAPNQLNIQANGEGDYVPKVGEWAVVIFDPIEDPKENDIQLFIVRVDP